jgi:hypothetical protein
MYSIVSEKPPVLKKNNSRITATPCVGSVGSVGSVGLGKASAKAECPHLAVPQLFLGHMYMAGVLRD